MRFRLRRLFLHDLGRKLLALALALATWWWVGRNITEPRTAEFTLVESVGASNALRGTLAVRKVEGWALTDPPFGSPVRIGFKAERGRLESFFNSQPAATFDPASLLQDASRQNTEDQVLSIPVPVTALAWNDSDAASLLSGEQAAILMRFEREGSLDVDLEPAMLAIDGAPSPPFALKRSEIVIEPNRVRVVGAASWIVRFERELGEWQQVRAASPDGAPPFGMLAAESVEGATRLVSRRLGLAPPWSDRIRMDPFEVLVKLPVQPLPPDPIEFDLPPPLLVGDEATLAAWERLSSSGRWRLSFEPIPDFQAPVVDQDWIDRNLLFLIDVSPLEGVQLDEQDLPIRVLYRGEDERQYEKYRKALKVVPLDPADATVKMRRRQLQQ